MKRYRFKTQDSFAGLLHRSNLFLKPPRGSGRAELTGAGYDDWQRVAAYRSGAINIPDPSGVAHVRAIVANTNNVIGRGDRLAGEMAHGDITIAGGVKERIKAQGRVVDAGDVVKEGTITDGRVVAAFCVIKECKKTLRRVVGADGVAKERLITGGRVASASAIHTERLNPGGCVEVARRVAKKRSPTDGRVAEAGSIEKERERSIGTVSSALGVA